MLEQPLKTDVVECFVTFPRDDPEIQISNNNPFCLLK